MRLSSCIESLLPAYKEFRKSSIDKQWLNLRSFVKRIFGSTNEFARLMAYEAEHYQEAAEWMDGYLRKSNVSSKEDIELLITYFKSFKERGGVRSAFLILVAGIIGTIGSIKPHWLYLLVMGSFLLAMIFERHHINAHVSYANDLAFLLEQKKATLRAN